MKADKTTTRVDTATAVIELTENVDMALLCEASEPAEAVLADSDISEGVAPSMKDAPHVELKALETSEGIVPGKSLFTIL